MKYKDVDLRAKLLSDVQVSAYVDSRAVRANEKKACEQPDNCNFEGLAYDLPPAEPAVSPVVGILQRLGFL